MKIAGHLHDYAYSAEAGDRTPGVWRCGRCGNEVRGWLSSMPCVVCSAPVSIRGSELADYAFCGTCARDFLDMEPRPESVSGSKRTISVAKDASPCPPRKLPPGVRVRPRSRD